MATSAATSITNASASHHMSLSSPARALVLKGSSANLNTAAVQTLPDTLRDKISRAMRELNAGDYASARPLFEEIAQQSQKQGLLRAAAMNWNNAGGCSVVLLQYGAAQRQFQKAKDAAESTHYVAALAKTAKCASALPTLLPTTFTFFSTCPHRKLTRRLSR